MKIWRPVVPVLALLFGLFYAPLACAQGKEGKGMPGASAAARPTPEVRAMTRFSNDGKAFTDDVRAARTAIFNGDPKTAKELMTKARASLEAAKKDAPSFNIKTTTSARGKVVSIEQANMTATLIPVDGQMMIADDYTINPEKQAHIGKANEHLKKGEPKGGHRRAPFCSDRRRFQSRVDFHRGLRKAPRRRDQACQRRQVLRVKPGAQGNRGRVHDGFGGIGRGPEIQVTRNRAGEQVARRDGRLQAGSGERRHRIRASAETKTPA